MWICDLENLAENINSFRDEQLVDVIIMANLVLNESIEMFEAESILQTIADVKSKKVPVNISYPTKIDERALRVSFLYSKLYFILHSCLGSVGIKRFQVKFLLTRQLKSSHCFICFQSDFLFDNVYFQMLYETNKGARKNFVETQDVEEIFRIFQTIIDNV